jgi:hypothetical protein
LFGYCAEQISISGSVGNAGVVTNTADPFDSPEQVIIQKVVTCVNNLAHLPIITNLSALSMSQFREPALFSRKYLERSVALILAQIIASRI